MKRLALLLVAVLLLAAPASAFSFRWKVHKLPFTLILVSELDDPTLQALTEISAAEWSESSVVDLVFGDPVKRKPFVRIVDGAYGPTWNGLTSISNERGYITAVTIYLNTDNLDGAADFFKQNTICQEIGHALGLDHREGDSCMGTNASNISPDAVDFANLEALYG